MKVFALGGYGKLKYLMNIKMAKNGELEKAILEMLNGIPKNRAKGRYYF